MRNCFHDRAFGAGLFALALAAPSASAAAIQATQERADRFLSVVNAAYQGLYYVENEAMWKAATDVTPAHDAAAATAGKARAAFVGNPALITEARQLLRLRSDLNDLTIRQLERLLLIAAESPMTNPKLTTARIEAETAQASTLNSFEFRLAGKTVTTNEIDNLLNTSIDLAERRAVWEASKESGKALKNGLMTLRDLRNGVAKEMGYPDYFSLQVARYGLSSEEMLKLNADFMRVLQPLYEQLHTWTKYKLAEKFKQPVPNLIPAHWINNRWSQEWAGLAEGADLAPFFKGRTPEWIVKTAESFYTGMGFAKMPASFWPKSDLYPVAAGSQRKKNTHASAWHLDLDSDIRSLMSIETNDYWFGTAHHELGHVYYFMSYTRPEVPPLLRDGANPGFHEGFGELTGLASAQVPYLKSVGLLPADFKADENAFLLNDSLSAVPFIYWSSGVMAHWEADIYARNLPVSEWNARWWQYVREFQGIEPPGARGEEFCDPATKTHINDNPAYYHNYAFAQVFKHQLHDYIARKILKQPPQSCNYADNKEVGDFIRKIMMQGLTGDWRKILRDATGEELSTRAMIDYYAPLRRWLEKENAGRPIGWKGATNLPRARGEGAAAPGEVVTNDAPLNWTTQQDHQNMLEQLGIKALRPGPSGRAGAPNSANYDPAKANPFPDLPDALTLKSGEKVTSAESWWKKRRPEIVEDFEREIIGRVPKDVPPVTWTVTESVTDGLVGQLPANGKKLVGHVHNSACPAITVDIRMTLVTPAKAREPVPLLMMFGGFGGDGMPRAADAPAPANRGPAFGGPFKDPPSTEQLLAAGWGYVTIIPGSIQADNGAGLTKGIIGLVNKGQPRKPDDWGSLRAWAWGAARALDYLETDPVVDAKRVGIEGVSRFGKAALITQAFEPRFAVALVGSSGAGGAKLHRRNFGEAVENLTGAGEYHWMAGNFLKYGAAEAKFGSRNAGDLPVDAHQLIALCAPRPTFISYGVPERGDANWLDQQGSYMATVAAGPVFRLLGVKDVGETHDYRTATLPPVNTGLLDGELAWRQHDGGHEDRSNMKHFIAWASRQLKYTPPASAEVK